MNFVFHREALVEYQEAALYYASRKRGLGLRFVAAVEQVIDEIVEAPQRWPILEEDVRRRLTRTFPYAVLYTIETDFILIVAVMHCSREPEYWKHRPKIKPSE